MEWNLGESVKLDDGFTPLPAGWYSTCITKLEFKASKSGGEYLSAEFTVVGEEYAKRKVFTMFNLVNKNPKAVEIALKQIKSLLIETGCDETQLNSVNKEQLVQLLMNKSVGVKLKIEVDPSGQYGDKNVIVAYKMTSEEAIASQPF